MDLLPEILTLMKGQEERLMKRIDEVHEDVKDTNKKITLQNGRLRKVELKVERRDTYCDMREKSVDGKFGEMEPTIKVTRLIRIITKNPKLTTVMFAGIMIGTQCVVLLAIENQWIGHLISLIR